MTTIFSDGDPVPLGDSRLSVVTDEIHTLGGTVSRFAREDKAPAADHVILDPDILEVVVALGNTPSQSTTGASLRGSGRGENARTVLSTLEGLRDARGLLEILTEHRLYTDMVLVSLGFQNTAAFSGSASLRAKFEQSPSAVVETLAAADSLSTGGGGRADKTASPPVDAGRQNADDEETADNRSFAAKLLDRQDETYAPSDTP